MTPAQEKYLIDRLWQIAAVDDKLANEWLETSGSYSMFDEPGSVKIAREILADLGALSPPSQTRGTP